ncbi:uncharacterized protein LTR77_005557 [Saxophila tyrrhenica]|uniref:EthD domain-containing protein n=1 Tax=Saxophila tyrrhenica TaxID=1690608 RepID=A0AAV9PCY4_9PEZI|nr:hypothetical protein LTR77_005557 [Saxophila tyrrhenica]
MSSTTNDSEAGKPGILFVASTVLHPDALKPLDFVDWYENTHVQEVQSTGGISGTQRYESLIFHSRHRDPTAASLENRHCESDFLTIYNMPDLAFRESKAFRGLDGQSKPNEELLEKLFEQTAFVTRFAQEVDVSGSSKAGSDPAPFLLSVCAPSITAAANVLEKSSTGKSRAFSVREGSLLSEFNRSWEKVPSDIRLVEANDISQLKELHKGLEGMEGLEVGFWRLRRSYDGSERTPAGWKPK